MKELEVGEIAFGSYGVESYITGEIIKIDGDRISIQCNNTVVTLNRMDVWYYIPLDRKKLFLCK